MFIKSLKISSLDGKIRDLSFKNGINLIVDDTPNTSDKTTGNSVGKTTVLKLIDYCLGGNADAIYKDSESKAIIREVQDFLVEKEVCITLRLARELSQFPQNDIVICRNFLPRQKKLMEINTKNITQNDGKDFDVELSSLILGKPNNEKPSLKQIISHNIRFSDIRVNNTLKMVHLYTSLPEYEALFLYMFGLEISDRSILMKKLKTENQFKNRITQDKDKTELELQLSLIEHNIQELTSRKNSLNINENYENDLDKLNSIKYLIEKVSANITELTLRKELIEDTKQELEDNYSQINMALLKKIYTQATDNISPIQKTFEEMVSYHNEMIMEKIKFIVDDIPTISDELNTLNLQLEQLLNDEKTIADTIRNSDTFSDLEYIVSQLNDEHRKKGEVSNLLSQISAIEKSITSLNAEMTIIDEGIFTDSFQKTLMERLSHFNNTYFSKVSKELYDEEYGITFEIQQDKKTKKPVYVFKCFNNNTSTGKKQGEIVCFDLAYILFARELNIPHVSFILNDKKELMHGNQLAKVATFAKKNNIQLVFSMLKDKLPRELDLSENIVVELSQDDKLFRIESNKKETSTDVNIENNNL